MKDVDSMNVDIPSVAGTESVTAGTTGEGVTPNNANTSAETAELIEERSKPTIGQGVADTLNVDVEEFEFPEDDEVNDVDDDTVSSAANFCDNDSEIPPPDTFMRFVDTTEIVAEESPKEGEIVSPNNTDVMPVIDSTEQRVDTDARPSVADLGETTVEELVTETMPSVADTCEETIERPSAEAIPDVIGSVVDTIDMTDVELPNTVDITQNHKKFKRRKYQADDDNQIDVQERVVEKQMLENVKPTATDSWHLADVNQGSDDEDVVVVTSKRRTATKNLKMDENRFRLGTREF
ncbi:hypothetical protein LIER_22184 [Lithospermum erythrorhizon]|uniref:Uncharacterized protein n=1 Tax=Lithospermum erythrorhizon TaxID=34254 RepID=A0AAV3QSV7_LITER